MSPELALVTQTQDFSFAVFDLTSFPVLTWTDSGSGASVLATQSSMDAQPVLTNSAWGQPGLLYGPTTSMQAPAIWPTSAAYSVEVLLILYETDTAIVLGTSTHSLSIVDGWFYLIHDGQCRTYLCAYTIHDGQLASSPCDTPAIVGYPIMLTVTYIQSSGAVAYFINQTAHGPPRST